MLPMLELRTMKPAALPCKALFVIILATAITRFPFAGSTLFSWDSVQFALALRHFDVGIHQPHPPGYFLYVAAGRIFRAFIADDNGALVSLSITFNVLSALVLYAFLRKLVSADTALFTTLYYLFSPLVWFKSEVALSYMGEAFFTVCVGFFAFKFMKRKSYMDLILCTFFLGLSGGIRQNTIVFLIPLWFFVMLKGLKNGGKPFLYIAKHAMLQFFFLGAVTASWFFPMIFLSGGFHAYSRILNSHWSRVAMRTSFFRNGAEALLLNGAQLWMFLFYAFTAGLFLLACYFYFLVRNKKTNNETACFLALWCIPSVLFYVLVHINYPGYVFTFLPALFLLFGKSAEWLIKTAAPRVSTAILAALFIVNPVVFLFSSMETSAFSIVTHDVYLKDILRTIRVKFPPDKTTILSFNHLYYGFRHAMYYLPEYTSYEVYPEAGYNGVTHRFLGGDEHRYKHFKSILIPHSTRYVVLFSDPLLGYGFVEKALRKSKELHRAINVNFALKHETLPSGIDIYWYKNK